MDKIQIKESRQKYFSFTNHIVKPPKIKIIHKKTCENQANFRQIIKPNLY